MRDEIDSLRDEITAPNCTQLLNGISVCSVPKYDHVVDPKDVTFSTVFEAKKDTCIRFDHLPDAVGSAKWEEMSQSVGHGDIPDNYLLIRVAIRYGPQRIFIIF